MIIIPAIDLLNGKVVRLIKGDMENATRYYDSPLEIAKKIIDIGAKRLHIVDLDGAKSGTAVNFKAIESIANLSEIEIEVGGGIRSSERVNSYFNAGVRYAILGTVVAKDPETTKLILQSNPGRIVLGIDARKGKIATEGWYETSKIEAINLIKNYSEFDVESVIYTDIDKDGTLAGLNLEELKNIADKSPFPVIASGGVGSSKDLDNLHNLSHRNIKGCIVGKAFYEGQIDLQTELLRF